MYTHYSQQIKKKKKFTSTLRLLCTPPPERGCICTERSERPLLDMTGTLLSTPERQWFTRDLQRERVAVATADSKSATSWVRLYTDMFNCVMAALVPLKAERGRKHRTISRRGLFYVLWCLSPWPLDDLQWTSVARGFAIKRINLEIILTGT